MDRWTRRKFFLTSLAGSAFAGVGKLFGKTLEVTEGSRPDLRLFDPAPVSGTRPLIISSANGLNALDKGMQILKGGGDTLDRRRCNRRGRRSQR
jgi:hypothetical protein